MYANGAFYGCHLALGFMSHRSTS